MVQTQCVSGCFPRRAWLAPGVCSPSGILPNSSPLAELFRALAVVTRHPDSLVSCFELRILLLFLSCKVRSSLLPSQTQRELSPPGEMLFCQLQLYMWVSMFWAHKCRDIISKIKPPEFFWKLITSLLLFISHTCRWAHVMLSVEFGCVRTWACGALLVKSWVF